MGERELKKSCSAPSPPLSPSRCILILLAFCTTVSLLNETVAQDRRVYDAVPIRQVIDEIQDSSPYRFLYRDALVTGKTVSFEAPAEGMIAALSDALRPHRLQLQVDETRHQIVLSRMQEAPPEPPAVLTGQVIDDRSGARLPFATITWKEQERLRGVAANAAGTFHLPLDDAPARLDYVVLTASYVGYRPRHIRVDVQNLPATLPIRLTPEQFFGHEVVVSSTVLDADLDTTWHHLLRPGLFSPLGESSVLRSLQSLPAVSLSTAFTQGLNVRGSKADGFQVLLDGIPIYNQNHFFGLFDAFNEDALQTVGFYYGVAPAHFQAPPGGTLSFVTRTGSQTDTRLTAGLSNTALKATLEGPLWDGRGSWLVSGRHSYLNAIDWFNNDGLIAQGLDVGREISAPIRLELGPNRERAFLPGTSSARFYDLHGKLYRESPDGNRLMVNLYLGGDHTRHQEAQRLSQPDTTRAAEFQPVETRNTWGNTAASLHDQRALGATLYGHTILAFSRYHSRFSKDDFIYPPVQQPEMHGPSQQPPDAQPRLAPFEHNNTLFEVKLAQHIDLAPRSGGTVSTGYALHRFAIDYEEQSALRKDFFEEQQSMQFDLFAQYDGAVVDEVDLHAGLRSHYFSEGRFLRLSPRLRLRAWPQRPVSLGVGYSRNYQFLHRLYLEHENSSDVWVMSTEDQGPGSVDNLTAGLYVKVSPTVFLQAEAYVKAYENLRQHESLAARRGGGGGDESLLQKPWLHDYSGRARGLELMLRHRVGALLWNHSYTLSKMTIRHDTINNGEALPADWDRRHQFTSHVQGTLLPHLSWHLTWLIASGAPNSLAFAERDEPATLPAYHRMDVGLQYRRAFRGVTLETTATIFNVYDRDNTWYRSPVAIFDPGQANRRVSFVNVDVYDLGFQPSFSLSLTF